MKFRMMAACAVAAFAIAMIQGEVSAQKVKSPVKGVLTSGRATSGNEVLPAPPAGQVLVVTKVCVHGGTANVVSDSLDIILNNSCVDLSPGFVSASSVTCSGTSGAPTCMATGILTKAG